MISAINGVISIFIMIGIGFLLTKKKWFSNEIGKLFSKLVINISLPALMVSNIISRFDRNKLLLSGKGILLALICILLIYLISIFISKIFKIRNPGLFSAMFTFSNSIFIGLPINTALFGEESVIYVLYYYFANTALFWTVGVYNIRKYNNNLHKISIKERLQKIISPPLLGFLVGVVITLSSINLPTFFTSTLSYLGNLTTPLSMFFIGITIGLIDLQKFKLRIDSLLIITGKFLVSPMIFIIALSFVNYPQIMENVFIIEAVTPILTSLAIVCSFYDVEAEYSAFMVALTTIVGLFIIPIYSLFII